jgi:hypothetical protein
LNLAIIALAALPPILSPTAARPNPQTITCASFQHRYTECQTPFHAPILVMQTSNSACIVNNTWGFNPRTGNLWVSNGCQGVFADQHGYQYGLGGGYDPNAHRYNNQGAHLGVGPIVIVPAPMPMPPARQNTFIDNRTINNNSVTIQRSTPPRPQHPRQDDIDPTPQFDQQGNPNFDTHGNYQGPHGVGKLVGPEDNPDTNYGRGNPDDEGDNGNSDERAAPADNGGGGDGCDPDDGDC